MYCTYWLVRESNLPACGPPASFSVHLASSVVTPVGSVHKSMGDNYVKGTQDQQLFIFYMINNNLSNKHNTLIIYRLCIGQRCLLCFYSVYVLQIYSVRWIENYRKGQEPLVENMDLSGKRRRKQILRMWVQLKR